MGLRVSGKHFQLGENLRRHVEDRIGAAAQKFFDGGISGSVVLDHEGSGYRTDCTLHLTSGVTLHSEGYAHDPSVSFDLAAERLERRLRRYHRRLKAHHQPAAHAVAELPSTAFSVSGHGEADREDEAAPGPAVIAETRVVVRTHSVSSAVVELDLTGAPVILFRHATSGRVNIVYRRPDGHIGWVDPSAAEEPRPALSQ